MKKTLALLLALSMLLALCACGSSSSGSSKGLGTYNFPVPAMVDEDGTAYYPTMDGGVLSIEAKATSDGSITPDRTKVVLIEESGKISWYNADLSEQITICKDGFNALDARDENIVYIDADYDVFRYTFADQSSYKFGNLSDVDDLLNSDKNGHICFAADGNVYMLPANSEEKEKLGSYTGDPSILFVASDASSAIWVDVSGKTETIYMYENGERTKIGTMEPAYSDRTKVVYCKDESAMLICNIYADVMYYKVPGQEAVKMKLGDELSSANSIYTASGYLEFDTAKKANCIYALVDAEEGSTLYYFDMNGDREKVIGQMDTVYISNGKIVYLNIDGDLYSADIKGSVISNETKITGDVDNVKLAPAGSYVYYFKNYDNGEVTLYSYKIGDKEPSKVSGAVYAYDVYGSVYSDLITGDEGKTVYYYKNVEKISGTSEYCGDLYRFTAGDKEPVKISGDVILGSFENGVNLKNTDGYNFIFCKYVSTKDGNIYANWIHYNGKETTTFAKDVIYGG